jgi:hypothetical protein
MEQKMNVDWLLPWLCVTDESVRSELEKELEREVHESHPLWGSSRRTILAKRSDQDDVLVRLDNGKIAEVHLTWTRTREQGAYPRTVIFNSVDDWRAQSMLPAHDEFMATGGK